MQPRGLSYLAVFYFAAVCYSATILSSYCERAEASVAMRETYCATRGRKFEVSSLSVALSRIY
jgi:hypothetical protein